MKTDLTGDGYYYLTKYVELKEIVEEEKLQMDVLLTKQSWRIKYLENKLAECVENSKKKV